MRGFNLYSAILDHGDGGADCLLRGDFVGAHWEVADLWVIMITD